MQISPAHCVCVRAHTHVCVLGCVISLNKPVFRFHCQFANLRRLVVIVLSC